MVILGAAILGCTSPDGGGWSATSLAAARFARVTGPATGGSVLDVGPTGSWMAHIAGFPTVLRDAHGYRMWFTGQRAVAAGEDPYLENGSIGLATSSDGVHWTVANGGQPVFGPGPAGAFDQHAVFHPFVLDIDGLLHLWYGGADSSKGFNGVRIEQIGLATSTDGIHWTRANGGLPVLSLGPPGSADDIQATGMHVLRDGNRLLMWYGAYDGVHTILHATSNDGVSWSRANAGRPVEGLDSASTGVLGPSVHFDGTQYVMLFGRRTGQQWTMFSATSHDGIHWNPAAGGQPLVGPAGAGSFDEAGPGRNQAVHPSQIVLDGRKALVWYMGEDPAGRQRVGLLEALLP